MTEEVTTKDSTDVSNRVVDDLDLEEEVAENRDEKEVENREEKEVEDEEKEVDEEENKVDEEENKVEDEEDKVEAEEDKVEAEENKVDSDEDKVDSDENTVDSDENKVEVAENKVDSEENTVEEKDAVNTVPEKNDGEDVFEDIPLSKEPSPENDLQPKNAVPPPRPARPQAASPPAQPPRPSTSDRPSARERTSTSPALKASPSPSEQNNHMVLQLKEAFPAIPTKVLTAVTIASQNNIESCYDACLYYMNPGEFKPTFHPDNFQPKQKVAAAQNEQMRQEEQMRQDELLARDLDRKYNSRPPPPPRSKTLRARDSRVEHGSIKRGQLPNEYDSEDEYAEEPMMKNFIDNDLPAITQNVGKTFRETSSKVGSWFRSLQNEGGSESSSTHTSKRDAEAFRKHLNNTYQYDEWGNPVFEHKKSYKIVERSPSNENKVLPQRFPVKTPSKDSDISKPYINTPSSTGERQVTPQQQRSVSGSGNKRLVFVEPVDTSAAENKAPHGSVDDDLDLSD